MRNRGNRIPQGINFFQVDFPNLYSLHHKPQKRRHYEYSEASFKSNNESQKNPQAAQINQQQVDQQHIDAYQHENYINNKNQKKQNFHFHNTQEEQNNQENSQSQIQQQANQDQQSDKESKIRQQIESLQKQLQDFQTKNKKEPKVEKSTQWVEQNYQENNEYLQQRQNQSRNRQDEFELKEAKKQKNGINQLNIEDSQMHNQRNYPNFSIQQKKINKSQILNLNPQDNQKAQRIDRRNMRYNVPISSDELRFQRKLQQFSISSKKEEEELNDKIIMFKVYEIENMQKMHQEQRQLDQKLKNQKLMNQIQYREALREQQKLKLSYDLDQRKLLHRSVEDELQPYKAAFQNIKHEPYLMYNQKLLPEIKSKTKQKNEVFDPIIYQQKVFPLEANPIPSLGIVKPKDKTIFPE